MSENYNQGARLESFFGLATPVMAAIIEMAGNIDRLQHPTFVVGFDIVKASSLYLYLLFIALYFYGKFLTRKGDKVIWETLQSMVDKLQEIAFSELSNEPNDSHRVTLFKYKKWCWTRFGWSLDNWISAFKNGWAPWSGWLVPVLRSGHTDKATKTVFLAPGNGRDAEGVAGMCWRSDSVIKSGQLPNIAKHSKDRIKRQYAKNSYMPFWMVGKYADNGRSLALDIVSYPVLSVSTKRWGVIVFDSQQQNGIKKEQIHTAYQAIIEPIGVLVEGV